MRTTGSIVVPILHIVIYLSPALDPTPDSAPVYSMAPCNHTNRHMGYNDSPKCLLSCIDEIRVGRIGHDGLLSVLFCGNYSLGAIILCCNSIEVVRKY